MQASRGRLRYNARLKDKSSLLKIKQGRCEDTPRDESGTIGLAAGVDATLILGFTWGGWVTGGSAEKMAKDRTDMAVVAALLPICVAQSEQGLEAKEKLAGIDAAAYYSRGEMIEKTGWANMPGTQTPIRGRAAACASKLGVA